MNNNLMFSHKSDDYSTPKEFYKALDTEFNFTFDPCPLRSNEDGLQTDWVGNIFINPPYSNIKGFLEKGLSELEKGNAKTLVYLVPARTDTKWFWDYVAPYSQLNNNIDYAYAAGLIDGEGCIFVRKNKDSRRVTEAYDLGLKVTMTDYNSVKYLHNLFKVGHIIEYKKENPIHNNGWSWVVRSNKAAEVLNKILPYLKLKKEQALKALEFQDTFNTFYKTVPKEIIELRRHYYELIKELKHTSTKENNEYNLPSVEIRFIKGRLKFGDSKNSAPFPSMLIIFRKKSYKVFNFPEFFKIDLFCKEDCYDKIEPIHFLVEEDGYYNIYLNKEYKTQTQELKAGDEFYITIKSNGNIEILYL